MTQSVYFLRAWARTGPKEAGYVNHPSDRGGATRWGVTERVARANGYTGPMENLPQETAMAIAKSQYWDVLNLDQLAPISGAIAEEMFDTLYNGGDVGAWLQRCLNALNARGSIYPDMKVDGRIGPMTLDALKRFLARRGKDGETAILKALNAIQGERFLRIAEGDQSQEDFVFGWLLNRA